MDLHIRESRFIATPEKGEVSSLLYLPAHARALLVLGHGAGAGMRHTTLERISLGLAGIGVGTFRYQFPFMERGGGRDTQAVSTATVRAAIDQAGVHAGKLPLLAGGHSFGGRMTSLAAAERPLEGVKGLIFFGFPMHAPGKPGTDRAGHLPEINVPMLFLSGTRDTLNRMDLFQPLIAPLGEKATLHLLDTADHGYKVLKRSRVSTEDVFDEMTRVIDGWLPQVI
jgi:predicted alpha/beta-hydrolase family hydrolase